jgi:hypothetical protein
MSTSAAFSNELHVRSRTATGAASEVTTFYFDVNPG